MTESYRFGSFELQPDERRLLDDGHPAAVGPRAFDILIALVEHAGELVTKEDLLERVWPNLVVEENNLAVQVSALRKVLGSEAIATIPGRGYRFTSRLEYADAAAPSQRSSRENNIPQPLTSFVGREKELDEYAGFLRETRLLTLTGIGGCGKTRLAIALAERVISSFTDGVCFVDLAAVEEPQRVPLGVAIALGVREEANRPIVETLLRQLSERRLLLVLDNCEHLLDACAVLAERFLLASPGLRMLATSREGLGVAGERIAPVRSLGFPPPTVCGPQALLAFEAVRLFVDRARRVDAHFALDGANAPAVAEICRRLDGIPLALELAAARVKILSTEQIRARLDDRFRLLTGHARALPRQQTLLATLQWTYDHLSTDDRQWLQRLSVFVGGWTLDAATTVAGDGGDEFATMDALSRLVDESLVVVERTGRDGPRYTMLETVRQYAQDRLIESGAGDDVRDRHLRYFLALAEKAHHNFGIRDAALGSSRLDDELPNLLAAQGWCDRASNGTELGLELASWLRIYWIDRGLFALGSEVYADALARPGAERRSMRRAAVLFALGQHRNFAGHFADAVAPLSEALSIAREFGDDSSAGHALEKLALASAFVDKPRYARECIDEAIAIWERTGSAYDMAGTLASKAEICRLPGDFAGAAAAYEQSRPLIRSDNVVRLHTLHTQLARIEVARGNLARARDELIEAFGLLLERDSRYWITMSLDVASLLAAARGDWRRAARLQCVFDTTLGRMGGLEHPYDDRVQQALRRRARSTLGDDAYHAAYDAGRLLSLERALEETSQWLKSDFAR